MSQAKVEQYKNEKKNRKNWKSEQLKKKVVSWVIACVCVLAVGVGIYFVARPDYSSINTGTSVYDDAALASLVGYNGISLSDVVTE